MRIVLDAKWTCILLLALLALPGALAAEIRSESSFDLEALRAPAGEGWLPIAKGVWQRPTLDGRRETFAQGRDGLANVLPDLRAHLTQLAKAYVEWPDDERRNALEEYTRFIKKVEAAIAGASRPAGPRQGLTKVDCQYNFSFGANAFPGAQCTNNASANASYSVTPNTCESCEVQAFAYVERTCRGVTTSRSQSCFDSGTNVSCTANASLGGAVSPGGCFANAFASIFCPALNNLFLSTGDTDTSCGSGLCALCFQIQSEP